jgi:hypothetical protein
MPRQAIPAMNDHYDDPAANRPVGAELKGELRLGASMLPRSTIEIALNCAGFFVGLLIMMGDYFVADRSLELRHWQFPDSPQAMVWIFFVAGEFAFWATIVEPLWRWRARLRLEYHLRPTREIRIKLATAIVFFVLPAYFLVWIVPDSNLWHHDVKMGLVNVIAMIVALVAVTGIWYVRAALEATFAGKGPGGRPVHSVAEGIRVLLNLRGDLQRFITLLGAMVALSALTKGALRQAYLATGGVPTKFPADYVLLQGAYFTGLLALLYIPTYKVLAAIGADLIEFAYPIKDFDLDWMNLSEWQANRNSLEELLQLRSGAVDNLRASVSILAPAAASIVTVLLGTK